MLRTVRAFIQRLQLRPSEAVLFVLGALLAVYRLITVLFPIPSPPGDLFVPALAVILAGLYLTEKWRTWTGKPVLRMDSTLEKDHVAGCYRLRFWNDKGPVCKPRVRVERVVSNHGKQLAQPLPIELEWTHHPEGPAELGPRDVGGETVAVLLLRPWPWHSGTPARVYLFGHQHNPEVGSVSDFIGGWVDVDISAYSPDYNTERIERRFRFFYDENEQPMFFRPEPQN
jgi:hypothetical protein